MLPPLGTLWRRVIADSAVVTLEEGERGGELRQDNHHRHLRGHQPELRANPRQLPLAQRADRRLKASIPAVELEHLLVVPRELPGRLRLPESPRACLLLYLSNVNN